MAAALFAWHGAHVEDVCWLAAVFDLLATFFVLLVLVMVTQSRPRQAMIVASSALACLSKEAAYCLPLLVVCIALFVQNPERRQILKRAIPVTIACAAVFFYRLWYLQGFGGYRTASGGSIALTLRPLSVLQALALRIWAVLFIPLNWSQKPGAWRGIAAIAMLLSLAVIAMNRKWLSRPNLFPAILFVLLASLPALPLLLIGSDLAGARVLYLPSVGFSLLWLLILNSLKNKPAALVLGSSTLLFQFAALRHNQQIWVQVAQSARQACLDTARFQSQNPRTALAVSGLPATLHGVFFFKNGFPQCVALAARPNAVSQEASNPPALVWNDATDRIEPRHSPPH